MVIIKKIKNRIRMIYCFIKLIAKYILINVKCNNKKRIFLLGTLGHTNLGDQAQTYCTIDWIEKNYFDSIIYAIAGYELRMFNYLELKLIKIFIKESDMIFIQSGYNTTDLYLCEELLHRKVIQIFKNKQIVILPQTVYFISEREKQNTIDVYNSNKNVLFFARDEISYKLAKQMFYNLQVELFPDIVTTLIGKDFEFSNKREGILFCLRKDKEALYTTDEVENLSKDLIDLTNEKISYTDTTLNIKLNDFNNNRDKFIKEQIYEYSKYKAIITDRYHGTIFSLVANTPVIVISSTDHKLSSGVKWFPSSFSDYIGYAKDKNEIFFYVNKFLNNKYFNKLPEYFNENYYNNLKEIIEEHNNANM